MKALQLVERALEITFYLYTYYEGHKCIYEEQGGDKGSVGNCVGRHFLYSHICIYNCS